MKKTRGICLMTAGIVLLFAALFLVLYNWNQNIQAEKRTYDILTALKEKMPKPHYDEETEPYAAVSGELPSEAYADENLTDDALPPGEDLIASYLSDETVQETIYWIDENAYLGTITIPALGLELPVLSDWSYPNLRIAPCRYTGSVSDGNLVLAAHNYSCHFGRISELNSGDEILFTDGNGVVHTYYVLYSELIGGSNASAMEQGDEDWDLTLFTCTLSGMSRVTVRASLAENESK